MAVYEYGSSPILTVTIRNQAGAIVDPATLIFRYKSSHGAGIITYVYGTDPELVRETTGIYSVELYCEDSGAWDWEFKATSPNCVLQGEFHIQNSLF